MTRCLCLNGQCYEIFDLILNSKTLPGPLKLRLKWFGEFFEFVKIIAKTAWSTLSLNTRKRTIFFFIRDKETKQLNTVCAVDDYVDILSGDQQLDKHSYSTRARARANRFGTHKIFKCF